MPALGTVNSTTSIATSAELAAHEGDTTSIHGIADTSALATAASVTAHTGDTSDAHDASAVSVVPFGTIAATDVQGALEEIVAEAGGGGVTDADYLVGTAHAGLSAEIVVGASPGGELGGTWASPTVDATHSGSSHASLANVYVQAGDPGAVGAGKIWIDTSNTPEIVWRWRNDDDTAWRQLWKATPTAYIVGQNDGTTPGIDLNNDGALELDAGEAGLYISMNEGAGAIYGVPGEALVSGGADNVVWGPVIQPSNASWIDLTDSGATTLHSHAGGSGLSAAEVGARAVLGV